MWCWSGGRGISRKLSLSCSIVYYYNGAQRYERFLQVGRLYRALILLGLALWFRSTYVASVFMVLCIKFFLLTSFSSLIVSWARWDLPLTWLTNHRPSVLWHCWLGHVTRKIVSKMTYNVSSETLCVYVCTAYIIDIHILWPQETKSNNTLLIQRLLLMQ